MQMMERDTSAGSWVMWCETW